MTRVFALFDGADKLQDAQDALERAGMTADIERVFDGTAEIDPHHVHRRDDEVLRQPDSHVHIAGPTAALMKPLVVRTGEPRLEPLDHGLT